MEVEKQPEKDKKIENNEDYLEKTIGAFGLWQAKVCILAMLTRFLAMWNMLNVMFLTYDSSFTCAKFNGSWPANVTASTCYDDCVDYQFETGLFEKSFVSEFELICEKAWMASFVQTILMFGLLFGVFLFGWISDRYGRSMAISSSAILVVVAMAGSCFAPDYWSFCALRFLTGVVTGGQMIVGVVIVLEAVGARHRELAGSCVSLPDGIAEASLVAFVYFSPTWRVYLLSMSAASALLMMLQLMLPESPRWMMSIGQTDKARNVIKKAVLCNKLDVDAIEENIKGVNSMESKNKKTASYRDLFRSRKRTVRTLTSVSIWVTTGMSFFGINQYCTFLGTEVFLSVIIMGLIQIPGCFVASWLNKVFGRKIIMITHMGIIGLTMLLLIFTPKDHWAAVALGMIGFWAIGIAYNVVYVWVAELFPTPLRNMGFGVSSSGAKVGAMVAPFVANLSSQWLPPLVFSIIAFIGAAMCCILPETKGQKLDDDLD